MLRIGYARSGRGGVIVSESLIHRSRRGTARRLRNAVNEAEQRLWRRLKRLEIKGSHFRRQVPIGPYVADFACMAAHLLIELDGSQHAKPENIRRDEIRTRWLEREGYRVVRIWNNEIIQNINGVMEKIYAEVYGGIDAESAPLKHLRRARPHNLVTPPRRARRADPPPPGEGD